MLPKDSIHDRDSTDSESIAHCIQDTLEAQESLLQLTLSSIEAGTWAWNMVTDDLTWSDRSFELLGYPPGDVTPSVKLWHDRIHPDDRLGDSQTLEHDQETPGPREGEYRVIHPDGSVHWLWVKGQVIYNADRPVRMVGIIREKDEPREENPTRLAEITAALEENQTLLRLIMNGAQAGSWDWVTTGKLTWSPEMYGLYGIAPIGSEIDYETWYETCLHPEDRPWLHAKITEIIAQRQPSFQLEFRILHSQLGVRWILSLGQLTVNEQGETRLSGINMDISDRKEAELALIKQIEQEYLLNDIAQEIRRSLQLNDVLSATVCRVRAFLGADRVFIFQFQPDWQGEVIMESVGEEWTAALSASLFDPCFRDHYIEAYRQGRIGMIADIEIADIRPCHLEFLQQFEVKANLVVPILQNNHLWGLLIVHQCSRPREWQRSEVAAIQRIATQLGIAIQQAELYQQLEAELNERRQAEQQIRDQAALLNQTNQLLELFIRSAPVDMAMFDREMRYVAVSQCWIDNYALESIEAVLNRSHYELLPELPEHWKAVHQRCLAGAIEKCDAELITGLGGKPRWMSWAVHPWYQANQEIGGIIILGVNISAQKATEEVLKSAKAELEIRVEERTAELQHTNDRLHLMWNITQRIRQSLNFSEILKIAVKEVRQTLKADRVTVYRFNADWSGDFIAESVGKNWAGQDWITLIDFDVQKLWKDTYFQDNQEGGFQNQEIFRVNDIYTANLDPCHIELLEQFETKAYVAVPIFVGKRLWGILIIYQNSTPRIWQDDEVDLVQQIAHQLAIAIQQSELYNQLQRELQERQQAEAKIREGERRWRSLLENVQLLVVGLDQWGTIEYVNPFFSEVTGYIKEELLGQNYFESYLAEPQKSTQRSDFENMFLQGTDVYCQTILFTKSGEERIISWNTTLLQDADGTTTGSISIGQDITERQKIENMKNEFIGIVSHELRTPLTAIQMSLGLLNTEIYLNNPQKYQRMIEIAFVETKRLGNLVNDILDLERLESYRLVLEKSCCSAMALMEQAVATMKTIALQREINIIIAPTDIQIWAAPDTIIQTLANLLSNAIKFSPDRSIIDLQADRQENEVLFQVRDQGRGIPPENLESIFGRFQQVDASDSREKGGTGLGLSICQSIIERHGGRIWAESTLGQGSTFYFTLPIPENLE